MTEINRLSALDSVSASDSIPIYSAANGDARKASMAVVKEFMNAEITAEDDKITQYSAPAATGTTVTVTNDSDSIWLLITPLAGYAAMTIVMPALVSCTDKQELLVNCTQAVTTLTINANGATVVGGPSTLAANAYFRLRFDAVFNTWYRVG